MKKLGLILGMVVFTFSMNAQLKNFEISKESPDFVGEYVVVKKDSMSVSDGYNKVLEWININYNTPSEVIKATLKNNYIRIEGYDECITSFKTIAGLSCSKGKYSLTFAFKENKIKVQLTRLQLYVSPSDYSRGGWNDRTPTYSETFKRNGKPKKGAALQSTLDFLNGLAGSMNDIRDRLEYYINNPLETNPKGEDNDDW